MLKLKISRGEAKKYSYEVRYKDFCYAVAKACTDTLKEYGFYGYHNSTYHDDMKIRYLIFLKAIGLDCLEVRELTFHGPEKGESSDFSKELELLLFDM
jgi:hypothetical protein